MGFISSIKCFSVFRLASFIVSSCCTKKDCDVYNPPLQIKLKNTQSIYRFVVLKFDKLKLKLDSTGLYGFRDKVASYWPYEADRYGKFSSNLYFKINDVVVDSVINFNYEWQEAKISCNDCFPFGRDSQKTRKLDNFSYSYSGKVFGLSDTIYLGK